MQNPNSPLIDQQTVDRWQADGVVLLKGVFTPWIESLSRGVAALMAKSLGVKLELVPVTGPNRIPYLLTNKVDVLIATFGITAERSKQVLFSNPYSSLTIYVLAPKSLNIKTTDDLKPVEVIVGDRSTITRADLAEALGDARDHVTAFKARPAFGSFDVVRNKNDALWR